ncbi:MAG: hypothetical protein EBZ48_11705 [Proteobacteria bacterium]|nr:hypothetical protein [Pseudomonadota bacterium]
MHPRLPFATPLSPSRPADWNSRLRWQTCDVLWGSLRSQFGGSSTALHLGLVVLALALLAPYIGLGGSVFRSDAHIQAPPTLEAVPVGEQEQSGEEGAAGTNYANTEQRQPRRAVSAEQSESERSKGGSDLEDIEELLGR